MRVRISKAICLSIVLVPLVVGTRAPAGVHATVNVKLNGVNDTQVGEFHAATQGSYVGGGGSESGSATAQGVPGVSGVLVTGSSTVSNLYGIPVYTSAAWNDTLTLSGPAGSILPAFVDLYFHTSCDMNLEGPGAEGTMGVGWNNSGTGTSQYTYTFGGAIDHLDNIGFWDSVQYGGGHLDGIWHQRVGINPIDPRPWSLLYETSLSGSVDPSGLNHFVSTMNGYDPPTFSFKAVLLPDGRTPEQAGLSLTFGSGIISPNLSAVPEPSSIIMLATGAVGLVGYGWRRRMRTSAEH